MHSQVSAAAASYDAEARRYFETEQAQHKKQLGGPRGAPGPPAAPGATWGCSGHPGLARATGGHLERPSENLQWVLFENRRMPLAFLQFLEQGPARRTPRPARRLPRGPRSGPQKHTKSPKPAFYYVFLHFSKARAFSKPFCRISKHENVCFPWFSTLKGAQNGQKPCVLLWFSRNAATRSSRAPLGQQGRPAAPREHPRRHPECQKHAFYSVFCTFSKRMRKRSGTTKNTGCQNIWFFSAQTPPVVVPRSAQEAKMCILPCVFDDFRSCTEAAQEAIQRHPGRRPGATRSHPRAYQEGPCRKNVHFIL